MTSLEEDDNYAEDECTMEFGEEEQPEPPRPTSSSFVGGPRYVEYPGEDFSKYLSDTPNHYRRKSEAESNSSAAAGRLYVKNTKNNVKSTLGRSRLHRPTSSTAATVQPPPNSRPDNTYFDGEDDDDEMLSAIQNNSPAFIPPPASPTPTRRKPTLNALRDRVGHMINSATRRGRSRSCERGSTATTNLQSFTFADSKIGGMMLAQLEKEQAARGRNSVDIAPETQSDLGLGSSGTWWDVGTLSSKHSLRLKDATSSTSDILRPHRGSGHDDDVSSSVPNLAESEKDETEDRRSLIGSISRALNMKRAARRNSSEAGLPSPPPTPSDPSNSTAAAPQLTSPSEPNPTVATTPRPASPNEAKLQQDSGRATKRGNLFKWLKEGVGSSKNGENHNHHYKEGAQHHHRQFPTAQRRKSEGNSSSSNNNVISTPRYTRIYEEVNRLTTDFRQTTVDNPLP